MRAFETLTAPPVQDAGGGRGKGKTPKPLARSNENCFRTAFACPRCKVEFNWPSSGNPDYYYNFFMQSAPRRAR